MNFRVIFLTFFLLFGTSTHAEDFNRIYDASYEKIWNEVSNRYSSHENKSLRLQTVDKSRGIMTTPWNVVEVADPASSRKGIRGRNVITITSISKTKTRVHMTLAWESSVDNATWSAVPDLQQFLFENQK